MITLFRWGWQDGVERKPIDEMGRYYGWRYALGYRLATWFADIPE